ncbi:MAG: 3-phosphoshikimate 1-carboxyvinyltransferase [Clostridia bacterium]|nr:3-phosphoshikimate 1-carboxyvinyltransferase [Clostridia bacterium]
MTVTIHPSVARGAVRAAPSKSMAHRLLICAALARGESVIKGVGESEDVKATIRSLSALGVSCTLCGDTVRVVGTDAFCASAKEPLFCNESGSTLRFLIPIALLSGKTVMLRGAKALFRRPMSVYEQLCRERGLLFTTDEESAVVRGPLTAGEYRVAGNVSSQFISGLLFALPLLAGDSVIRITPPLESRSYIDLTTTALAAFGVRTEWLDDYTLAIPGGQSYTPRELTVEGDYSGASYLAALGALGGEVTVEGLRPDSLQGDRAYERYFPMLLRGTPTIHIGDCPDLGPTLFAVAAARHGAVFTGTARLRIKESDRAAVMAEELAKFGTTVSVDEDSTVVYPSDFHAPREVLYGHNDHRIVMALAVLCTLTGGTIAGAEAVNKSFPDVFEKLEALGISLTRTNE